MIDVICNLGLNVELSDSDFSYYDGIIHVEDNEKYLIETKHRSKKYPDYVMEEKKISHLLR